MNMQVISSKPKGGFRELSSEEIMAVSGGDGGKGNDDDTTIVVTGGRLNLPGLLNPAFFDNDNAGDVGSLPGIVVTADRRNFSSFFDNGGDFSFGFGRGYDFGGLYFGDGGEGASGGGGDLENLTAEDDQFTEEKKAAAEIAIAALSEAIKADIEQLGSDFEIVLGDLKFLASDLVKSLDALGKLLTAVEAAQLTNDLLRGDASVGDALGFLAGYAVGAGLTAVGAPPLLVIGVTVAIGLFAPGAIDQFARDLNNGLAVTSDSFVRVNDPIRGPALFNPVDDFVEQGQRILGDIYDFFYDDEKGPIYR